MQPDFFHFKLKSSPLKAIKEIRKISPLFCGENETVDSVVSQMSKSDIGLRPVMD
jgi:hypothetical protein